MKRSYEGEENEQGKRSRRVMMENDLTMDAWSLVLPYISSSKDRWEMWLLNRNAHRLVSRSAVGYLAIIDQVHKVLFATRKEFCAGGETTVSLYPENHQETMRCYGKTLSDHCYDHLHQYFTTHRDALCVEYLVSRLTEDVNEYPMRYKEVMTRAWRYKRLSWCLAWSPKNVFFHQLPYLSDCLRQVQKEKGMKRYQAMHFCLVWYIRVTNDLRFFSAFSSVLSHPHFHYMSRPLGDGSVFLLTDWANNYFVKEEYHQPFCHSNQNEAPWSIHPSTYPSTYEDTFIRCQEENGLCDMTILMSTYKIYNQLFEEIGRYQPETQKSVFYQPVRVKSPIVSSSTCCHGRKSTITQLYHHGSMLIHLENLLFESLHQPHHEHLFCYFITGEYWLDQQGHVLDEALASHPVEETHQPDPLLAILMDSST